MLKTLLKIPVQTYKYLISPFMPGACRFHPTCSEYCLQALEKHGALAGLFLTLKRLGRCHPWSGKHGFDPVPEQTKNTKDSDFK